MVFNSYIFILILLPISVVGYFGINRLGMYKFADLFLVLLSFVFVVSANWMSLLVLVFSILFNYFMSIALLKLRFKRSILAATIVSDVLLLLYFKYNGFFVCSASDSILLPLGISFYTFKEIASIISIYNSSSMTYGLLEYARYISFFPSFSQGPIMECMALNDQFNVTSRRVNYDSIGRGLFLLAIGMAKKVLLADRLALIVNAGYRNIKALNSISAIIVILSYSLQIYFDFSGYSDMAVGVAKLFNIDLVWNFNSPYKSKTIDEFWDRWHISLTRFLTKYVYYPLGGSRRGRLRTLLNIMIVFLISGIWHGASITFIIWGCLHGLAKIVTKAFKLNQWIRNAVVQRMLTFIYVSLAWVFFRAGSLHDAIMLFKRLFIGGDFSVCRYLYEGFNDIIEVSILVHLDFIGVFERFPAIFMVSFIVILFAICFTCANSKQMVERINFQRKNWLVVGLLLCYCMMNFSGVSQYLYWSF